MFLTGSGLTLCFLCKGWLVVLPDTVQAVMLYRRPATRLLNTGTPVASSDGSSEEIVANHSMNDEQIGWFNAGSALNMIRQQQAQDTKLIS